LNIVFLTFTAGLTFVPSGWQKKIQNITDITMQMGSKEFCQLEGADILGPTAKCDQVYSLVIYKG